MDLFDSALCFAIEKHSGQIRKAQNAPYILHPLEAAAIVGTMTADPETLTAAVLHDVVEDAGVSPDEIAEKFGSRVAELVASETEDKREEVPAGETWMIRKEESLAKLAATADLSVKMMWLGDKLSNMRSFYRQYRQHGSALWRCFNQKDPTKQAWYYRTIAESLRELQDTDAYREYVTLMDTVFEHEGGSAI